MFCRGQIEKSEKQLVIECPLAKASVKLDHCLLLVFHGTRQFLFPFPHGYERNSKYEM